MNFSQTLLISITTASVAGILTWFGQYIVALLQRRNEKNKALEEEKRIAYKQLLKLIFDLLGSISSGKKPSSEINDDEAIFKIDRDLIVYASDEVFRLFVALRQASDQKQDVAVPLAKLVLAIRKDSGHQDTTVSLKEILLPVIKDSKKIFDNR